ncbi:MAG: 23S rRNA pseudouridine1911/1915/1917 synthase, partial [Saprospiraceae bacterium]
NFAEIYCKSSLYVVHRLDRPATGVVLFAKNKKALANLNQQFKDRTIKKTYLAVVKNTPENPEGHLVHYVYKNNTKNKSVATTEESPGTKKAELKYKVIGQSDNYSLLEIELITGRFHQIRSQLAAIGCPIRGDVKYGFKRGNKDRSIHLHAWKLRFTHPVSEELVELVAPLPEDSVWDAFSVEV